MNSHLEELSPELRRAGRRTAWLILLLLAACSAVGTLGLAERSPGVTVVALILAVVVLAYSRRWSLELASRAERERQREHHDALAERDVPDVAPRGSFGAEQAWILIWSLANVAAAVGVAFGVPPAAFALNLLFLGEILRRRRRHHVASSKLHPE